jgi:predicted Fe-Mo cluster-binding NifX family protein
MVVCVPVTADGQVGGGWGRADRVALAEVVGGRIASWQEIEVGWDRLHEEGTEGSHHARIARFLTEHSVDRVVAGHMGPPMQHMLEKMGVSVRTGAAGDARHVVMAEQN